MKPSDVLQQLLQNETVNSSDIIEALTVAIKSREYWEERCNMHVKTNQRLHRRLQLLEGYWIRKLERSKAWVKVMFNIYHDKNPAGANDMAQAYTIGYDEGAAETDNYYQEVYKRRAKPRANPTGK